jgi:hypothetical protein
VDGYTGAASFAFVATTQGTRLALRKLPSDPNLKAAILGS